MLTATLFISIAAVTVPAQAKDLTLTVTPAEASALINKYGELPWKAANPLMLKLIGQINDQMKPDNSGAAAPSLPPKVGDDKPIVKAPPAE